MDKPDTDNLPQNSENGHKRSSSSSSSSGCLEEQDLFQLDPTTSATSPELTQQPTNVSEVKLPPRSPPLSPSSSTPKSAKINGYDPNRIPAEIFDRTKSGNTPADWSTASNESLFSIHMGKSAELTAYYQAYTDYAIISPLESKEKEARTSVGDGKQPSPKGLLGEEDVRKERDSFSGHSTDGSIASHQSFAFPILTNDGKIGSLKNELVRHQTPTTVQMQPPAPPSEAPKEKSEPAPAESKSNVGCFSCLPWLPSCRCWGSSS